MFRMFRMIFKLIIIIFIAFSFCDSSDITDPWVVVHTEDNVIVKVRNSFYYEYLELSMQSEEDIREMKRIQEEDSLQYLRDVAAYNNWELTEKFWTEDEKAKQDSIFKSKKRLSLTGNLK